MIRTCAWLSFLLAGAATAAEEEVWHGVHPTPAAPPELVYPFDGRAPKISVQLHNHEPTTSPALVVNVRVNGRPEPAAEVFAGAPIVIAGFDYAAPGVSSAGVYSGGFGPPPAVGETRTYRFEFVLSLAPGAISPHPNQPATASIAQDVRFTNLGDSPTLTGPRSFNGMVRLAGASGSTALQPKAEVATPYSPWLPIVLTPAGTTAAFTFSQPLPQRNDWHIRFTAPGHESRLLALGNYFEPSDPVDITLDEVAVPDVEYQRRTAITTPTGFWRAAVSESEGTFVVFPGEENWQPTATDAEARALRSAGRIAKYRFDGTRLWEHPPGWETWGGAMTPDGRYIAYVLNPIARSFYVPTEHKLVLLDGATGAIVWSKSAPPTDAAIGRRLDSNELAFSPDARWIAVGTLRSGQVTLVDRASGNFAWSSPASGPGFGDITRLQFSPDSEFLYCGGKDGVVRRLRVSDGALVWRTYVHGAPGLNGLSISADGTWVAVSADSGDVSVVRAADAFVPWQKETQARDATLAPDSRHLATSAGQIYRTVEASLVGMTKDTGLTRFTPDGRHVLQLGRQFRLLDLAGVVLKTFEPPGVGSGTEPRWAHVSQDGRYAIVVARDMSGPPQAGIVIYERRLAAAGIASPTIQAQPLGQTVTLGGAATLGVTAAGPGPLAYRWQRDGRDVPGGASATLVFPQARPADAGNYTVTVSNSAGAVTSATAAVAVAAARPADPARIANLSVRAGVGAAPLVVGFAVGGQATSGTKTLLVRGVGPALTGFGVSDALRDPQVALFSGATSVLSNDNWGGNSQVAALASQVGAFPFADRNSADAAMAVTSVGGSFTVHVADGAGGSGTVLAEIYDGSATFAGTTPRLVNVSARGDTGGGSVLTAGFVVAGPASRTVLIRGIGPTLAQFRVPGVLADPRLTLFREGVIVAVNDNWYDAANAIAIGAAAGEVGAFAIQPPSRDAAILLTLPPGSYTAEVTGVGSASGAALVEVYEVP